MGSSFKTATTTLREALCDWDCDFVLVVVAVLVEVIVLVELPLPLLPLLLLLLSLGDSMSTSWGLLTGSQSCASCEKSCRALAATSLAVMGATLPLEAQLALVQ